MLKRRWFHKSRKEENKWAKLWSTNGKTQILIHLQKNTEILNFHVSKIHWIKKSWGIVIRFTRTVFDLKGFDSFSLVAVYLVYDIFWMQLIQRFHLSHFSSKKFKKTFCKLNSRFFVYKDSYRTMAPNWFNRNWFGFR